MTREYGSVASCQLPVASCQLPEFDVTIVVMLFVQLGYSYSVHLYTRVTGEL